MLGMEKAVATMYLNEKPNLAAAALFHMSG